MNTIPRQGITVARNGVRLGSRIRLFNHTYVVQDRMHQRYGSNHIDIFFNQHNDAKKFGVVKVNIK